MARTKLYNQGNLSASFNGIDLEGFMDGAPFTIEEIGGEVDITEGTDGGGLNQATAQGIKISIIFRETSASLDMLNTARILQQKTGVSSVFVVRSGANVLYTISNAMVGKPESLSTGDKKQGGQSIPFVGTDYLIS